MAPINLNNKDVVSFMPGVFRNLDPLFKILDCWGTFEGTLGSMNAPLNP